MYRQLDALREVKVGKSGREEEKRVLGIPAAALCVHPTAEAAQCVRSCYLHCWPNGRLLLGAGAAGRCADTAVLGADARKTLGSSMGLQLSSLPPETCSFL